MRSWIQIEERFTSTARRAGWTAVLLILVCACASDEERGCVIVKRHSKAGKVALQAAAQWCVARHAPIDTDNFLTLIAQAQYRVELGLAGPGHCDLDVGVLGQVDGVHYEQQFECRMDVERLDACLDSAVSIIDVARCTERATEPRDP